MEEEIIYWLLVEVQGIEGKFEVGGKYHTKVRGDGGDLLFAERKDGCMHHTLSGGE